MHVVVVALESDAKAHATAGQAHDDGDGFDFAADDVALGGRWGCDLGVRFGVECIAHALELVHVLNLDCDGFLAGELLHHEHEAFFGHADDGVGLAVLRIGVGGVLEIKETPFTSIGHACVNGAQNMVMPLAKSNSDVVGGGGGLPVNDSDVRDLGRRARGNGLRHKTLLCET